MKASRPPPSWRRSHSCTVWWGTPNLPATSVTVSPSTWTARREVDAGPLGTYTLFQRDGCDVAGMMNPTARDYAGSPPPRWIACIAVDDAARTAARVADLGGTVLEPPSHVSGVGTICMFKDPVGALIYVMEPELAPTE